MGAVVVVRNVYDWTTSMFRFPWDTSFPLRPSAGFNRDDRLLVQPQLDKRPGRTRERSMRRGTPKLSSPSSLDVEEGVIASTDRFAFRFAFLILR